MKGALGVAPKGPYEPDGDARHHLLVRARYVAQYLDLADCVFA